MKQDEEVKVGDVVVYHDETGKPYNALVTAVFFPTCVNVACVSSDRNMTDHYGRQTFRQSSVSHKTTTPAHGRYWRFHHEEPNIGTEPQM